MNELADVIEKNLTAFKPMFDPVLTAENTIAMDLSSANSEFEALDERALDQAIDEKIHTKGSIAGVGGYLENRSLYANTDLFDGDSERCIHVGVDVFMPTGTNVYLPLDGRIHSFCNRHVSGDYGPVIIVNHEIDGFAFHSLYGHLTEDSLVGLEKGQIKKAGDVIARIGPRPVNGNWPPHLHFQLIKDMQGIEGDYPGVVKPSELEFYKRNCPDPMKLILY